MGRVGVVGDLEKAFLQIMLKKSERNVCCFLWKNPDGLIVTYRLTRAFFGSTSSPFLLQVVLKHHLENEVKDRQVARELLRNLYVDDTVNSFDTDADAENFWIRAVDIFHKGQFNLRKFQSNSKRLNFGKEDEVIHKVLGIPWHVKEDSFLLMDGFTPEVKCWTKRNVASLMAGVYDPLGLVSPIMTPIKCFLQDLWKARVPWDTMLEGTLRHQLRKILLDMDCRDTISVPRWLGIEKRFNSADHITLHVFTDASCRAYAAAAYIRVQRESGTRASLVTSKCRLAPPNGETIPRLELLAILLGSRLLQSLKSEFRDVISIDKFYLWTDSTVALSWLEKGPSVGGIFIANRVREILTCEAERRWIPGEHNPADLPTRGTSAADLKDNFLWWHGPVWLCSVEKHWPVRSVLSIAVNPNENDSATMALMSVKFTMTWLTELTDPTRTSKWNRTLRSLCWIRRWKYTNPNVCIQPEELSQATSLIFQQVQRKFFQQELFAVENGETIPRQSTIFTLHPFLEDGLIRMGGRLQQSMLTHNEKHPVILRRCGVIDQLILKVHEQMQHGGASFVIPELRRQGIWILCPKKSVSSAIRACRRCRRFIAAPAAEVTPPFPDSRVNLVRVFDTTGMDLGGPLYLKDGSKVWFVLFTCMSVRAVHLELVSALSEEALLSAFQRFTARRGMPSKCISDHGTTLLPCHVG